MCDLNGGYRYKINFFWFCIAHYIINHLSAIILMCRLKPVLDNFQSSHTPMICYKSGWGKSTPRRKNNNTQDCIIFLFPFGNSNTCLDAQKQF